MKILIGTRNSGKIQEICKIYSDLSHINWLTHSEVPFGEVNEDGMTFGENAVKKARGIANETGMPVLAEDSGLEIDALNGEPGVYSARYAGTNATDDKNIDKVLELLKNITDRGAQFRTYAVLYNPSQDLLWESEGILLGKISITPMGQSGFGYDPIFVPNGYDQTLAQLGSDIKDRISHRRRALDRLREKLLTL